MSGPTNVLSNNRLPWWTWILPLFIFHLGTEISLWSKVTTGSSLFYFPAPMALILIYWWGPRVLPAFFLNATLSAGLWGLDKWVLWPLYAAPEVIFVTLSWLLFIKLAKGKCWLPNIEQTLLFLVVGIVVPLFIYKIMLEGLFVYFGDQPYEKFWFLLSTTSLGDFISTFGLTIPVLYFFTGPMTRAKLAITSKNVTFRLSALKKKLSSTGGIIEFTLIIGLLFILSRSLVFGDYWFVYGMIALYVAIRYGFGAVIIINSYILLLTYLIPSIIDSTFITSMTQGNNLLKIQLGSSLLYIFSTITGRVISDVAWAQKELNSKNQELIHINKELDRFVYSVSHDLSAPLKSIQGLVNISKLETSNSNKEEYLGKIGQSVSKLDFFIKEILDYSRNKRLDIVHEKIHLKSLCEEIIDNLKYIDNFPKIQFEISGLVDKVITADRLRLKIILNNLFSNAIKFQKRQGTEIPLVQVSYLDSLNSVKLFVHDNGEGIKLELKDKIFEMFYRGTDYATGSGLGLYIAREAAEKIGGNIKVESEYGKGSTFIIEIPLHP